MASPARALTNPFHTSTNHSPVTFITSLLQNLNPQTPNPLNLSSAPLNQFSAHLNPSLVIQFIQNQTNPYHALFFFFKWASNPDPNPNNYSHTFKCYLAITDLLLSHSLFSTASTLLQESNKLSDFMLGKFITAQGARGDVRAAIDWFHKAKLIESGRCLFSYNAILGVLVRANRIGLAKAIYDQIVKECLVTPNASTYTIMIRGYCKMGEMEYAQKVFDEIICEPNLITYNTMINGFCKKCDLDSARRVLGQMMEAMDSLPDTVTYTTLIDGYCKKGELGEARKCMDEMVKQGCEPNVLTYNALIHGFCLSGNVNEAKRIMTRMRLNGVKDDIATHSSILKGLCIGGKADEAVEHLKEMVRLGMKLDVKAYGIVVNEYCKMKEPDAAISLLMEMRMRGLKPSVSSFNAVLSVLVENGDLERAINLLKQMPQIETVNLCLFGFPSEKWEVNLPAEFVPPELPEPALGINFARDVMGKKDCLPLVAAHSEAWLLAVAYFSGISIGFDKADRKRLFHMINDLPSLFEVVTCTAEKEVKKKKKSSISKKMQSKSEHEGKKSVEDMDGGDQQSVKGVFRDFRGRRAGLLKALTTDVEEFFQLLDPEKENLFLYGFPSKQWEVSLPKVELLLDLPEPAVLGINFARDAMQKMDWLSLIAAHSDAWLLSVAYFFGARFDKADRERLFDKIKFILC